MVKKESKNTLFLANGLYLLSASLYIASDMIASQFNLPQESLSSIGYYGFITTFFSSGLLNEKERQIRENINIDWLKINELKFEETKSQILKIFEILANGDSNDLSYITYDYNFHLGALRVGLKERKVTIKDKVLEINNNKLIADCYKESSLPILYDYLFGRISPFDNLTDNKKFCSFLSTALGKFNSADIKQLILNKNDIYLNKEVYFKLIDMYDDLPSQIKKLMRQKKYSNLYKEFLLPTLEKKLIISELNVVPAHKINKL